MKNNIWSKLLIIIPIIIGISFIVVMKGNKQPPTKTAEQEKSYPVRTIIVPRLTITPVAIGYGAVQPAQIWKAVAQVSGRVVDMHPKLRNGEIIAKGSLLYRIDPIDYELNLAQAQAELAELDVQEKNTRQSIVIERRNVNLAERELKRLQGLLSKGSISQSDVDNAERTVLSSRTPLQNLSNTLALIPVQKKLLLSKIKQAERDLAETQVYAPFNLRIANMSIEQQQFISTGQNLFQGDSVERIEVVSQVALSSLKNLFIDHDEHIPSMTQLTQNMVKFASFKPVIKLDMGSHIAQWQAEFVRFTDAIDPQTRTIGVVVAVDKPFAKVKPGIRPPLSKGMFVEVKIQGKEQTERLIIPRNTIRDGHVMLVNEQNRLTSRKVDILYNQMDISVLKSGLQQGEQLIVSDVLPAVNGMLLTAIIDENLQQQLNLNSASQPVNNTGIAQ